MFIRGEPFMSYRANTNLQSSKLKSIIQCGFKDFAYQHRHITAICAREVETTPCQMASINYHPAVTACTETPSAYERTKRFKEVMKCLRQTLGKGIWFRLMGWDKRAPTSWRDEGSKCICGRFVPLTPKKC